MVIHKLTFEQKLKIYDRCTISNWDFIVVVIIPMFILFLTSFMDNSFLRYFLTFINVFYIIGSFLSIILYNRKKTYLQTLKMFENDGVDNNGKKR